jgi:hypothetical protein
MKFQFVLSELKKGRMDMRLSLLISDVKAMVSM